MSFQAPKNSLQVFDSLRHLNVSKYDWKIKVRVLWIWEGFGHSKTASTREFKSLNLMLIDKDVSI